MFFESKEGVDFVKSRDALDAPGGKDSLSDEDAKKMPREVR